MKILEVPDDLIKLKSSKLPLPKDLKQRGTKENVKDNQEDIIWDESK